MYVNLIYFNDWVNHSWTNLNLGLNKSMMSSLSSYTYIYVRSYLYTMALPQDKFS